MSDATPFVFPVNPVLGKDRLLALAEQWRALIEARGRVAEHVAERHMEVCWLLAETGYELTDTAITIALGKLRREGRSNRTCNKYLSAVKSFTRWLARPSARVLVFDPLADVPAFHARRDRRHVRTSFWPVFGQLLAAAEKDTQGTYLGLTGPERAELYHAAACTGVRFGTLARLTVSQFDLTKPVGILAVRADQAKGGRDILVPIQPDSTDRLRRLLKGKAPTARAFKTPKYNTGLAKMIRRDLKEAGIPYCREVKLGNGRWRREEVLDFHALRHTFASWHASSGTPLGTLQKLMGHSTPDLTSNVYSHLLGADLTAAAANLPPLPGVRRAG